MAFAMVVDQEVRERATHRTVRSLLWRSIARDYGVSRELHLNIDPAAATCNLGGLEAALLTARSSLRPVALRKSLPMSAGWWLTGERSTSPKCRSADKPSEGGPPVSARDKC